MKYFEDIYINILKKPKYTLKSKGKKKSKSKVESLQKK